MYSIPWYVAIFESISETLLVILLGAALAQCTLIYSTRNNNGNYSYIFE